MLIVEMIAKIRRAFFVQGKAIKAICRELRISRKVVLKVLRSEATIPLRARGATASEDWALEGQARSIAIGERREGVA
jgi:hypothetical protein